MAAHQPGSGCRFAPPIGAGAPALSTQERLILLSGVPGRLRGGSMDVLYPYCAGIDVHKKTISVCVLTPGAHGKPQSQIREYGTHTRELLEMADWLLQNQVTHVGMESTGVYWKPIWNILEAAGFTLTLANAQHVKNVPGKKTDTADCVWLAQLLRHGLLPGSFVPEASLRELRELTRARVSLVRERAAVANRMQKTLEDANIKLGNVVSDILGVSSRAMLQSFVDGESEAARIATLARGRMRSKQLDLTSALEGKVSDHHRFLWRE